jgi:hypothetical protein
MKLTHQPPAWLRRVPRPPSGPNLLAVPLLAVPLFASPLAADSISQVLNNTTLWILATLATLMLTLGGVRYLLANGDPAQVEQAKTALKSAAIGYGLAILAPVIVAVLKSLVGG